MTHDISKAAHGYANRGWHVFPAPAGEKKSHKAEQHSGTKWGMTTDTDQIARDWKQWPKANVGIVTGPKSGFFVIEADTSEGHGIDGIRNLAALIELNGQLPDTIEALSPSGSWHIYFKWPDDVNIANSASQVAEGVDVRGDGGMVIGVPSVKPGAEKPYRWKNPPGLFELADCPTWLLQLCLKPQQKQPKLAIQPSKPNLAWATKALESELAELEQAPNGKRNEALNKATFSLAQIVANGGLDEQIVRDSLTAAANNIGLEPKEIEGTIESGFEAGLLKPRGPSGNSAAIVAGIADFDDAERATNSRSYDELLEAAKALKPDQVDQTEAIVKEAGLLKPVARDMIFRAIKVATKLSLPTIREQLKQETVSDKPGQLDLAKATIQSIGDANLICDNATVWRWQDRGIWTEQNDRAIMQSVQFTIDDQMIEVSSPLVKQVTDVLKTDIYKPNHKFNLGHPETVNCLNGELRLNECMCWDLEPHNREHYRTTQIPVAYDPNANAPMFKGFLDQVFRDDPDKADKAKAVLELMGYTLMCHARHEKFVMLIGPGANGKSVLLAVLEGLVGAGNVAGVQPSNFNNRFQRAHLNQKLANIVTELKQGEVIADAELKAITSGEAATVENKHRDPFVIRPFATCWFGTNHMPHTRDFSDALFRRAVILQFNRTFAGHEQDPLLKDKLLAELPGILNLSLEAYASALGAGFTSPASNEEAKQAWRLEADQVAQFVDESCKRDTRAKSKVSAVFEAYQNWALVNGIKQTMSKKGLRERLTNLGFGAARSGDARYVTGLHLPSWLEREP